MCIYLIFALEKEEHGPISKVGNKGEDQHSFHEARLHINNI